MGNAYEFKEGHETQREAAGALELGEVGKARLSIARDHRFWCHSDQRSRQPSGGTKGNGLR